MISMKLGLWIGWMGLLAGCGATTPSAPPTAPDAKPADPSLPPPSGATVEVKWNGVGHRAAGRARVTIGGGRGRVEFLSDFSVEAVPAPYLYLGTAATPNSGTPLRIARLRANSGAQQYDFEVPAGIQYTWILIWCDQFNVPVAEAAVP